MAVSLHTHTHTHPPTNTHTHPPRSHPLPASRLGEKQDTGGGEDGHLPTHTHTHTRTHTHTHTQEVVKMAISLYTHTQTPRSHPLPASRLGEKQDTGGGEDGYLLTNTHSHTGGGEDGHLPKHIHTHTHTPMQPSPPCLQIRRKARHRRW